MSTNHHTPWEDGVTTFSGTHMNAPLGELDQAITDNAAAIADNTAAIADHTTAIAGKADTVHTHDDRYFTETELSTPSSGATVDWTNLANIPTIGTGDGDVVGPAANTDNKVPQWDGANSKTLKDGLTVATSIGSPGVGTSLPTEKAVRDALDALPITIGDTVSPASNTDGNIPQWDGANSKTLKDGLAVATSIGNPGVDTALATEKAVRDAIGAIPESGDVTGPATHAADYVPQWNGFPDSKALVEGFPITVAGKALIDDASAAAQRTTLGVDVAGIGLSYQSTDKPAAGAVINCIFPYGITFPANLTGAVYYGAANPTDQVVASFQKNDVEFGTLTVATNGTATFAAASQTAFVAGDRFSVVFPAPQDATWAGPTVTLKGVKA